jgi:amino acid transporter
MCVIFVCLCSVFRPATFFNVVSEMKNPKKDYAKALFTCQGLVTLVYLVIGGVVYHYAGQYVSSPALGSAGPLLKKVCYGIAIPGLLVGATLNTHTPAKYVLVRVLKGEIFLMLGILTNIG